MKTHSFFHAVATATLLAMTLGCGDDNPSSSAVGSATIELTQNGQVVTEFQTAKACGIGDGSYALVISSTDEKHTLTLSIQRQSPGTYSLSATSKPSAAAKPVFCTRATHYRISTPARSERCYRIPAKLC